mmetsp:Transcript_4565/g.8403  ORF Transcript_4565/g.8403 Transcript_4565/m.8403 type:complete len:84 (-) Transcript_4565:313-564(-)|eukprot:CAMPEP_0202508262 /NCGR_PEP_ID=MMETSP1361-20130828/52159_1 /ASSEMBLY_ACC=CAM_ASM_000849 /TAXON_ID=210615 /ORGANISM="Staurosira complex sp., Strain CCMP2646" /LENGTH=83 /DNA_ID=CAMNT_0049142431 /DNA_START=2158 /DNA_END=2409 /DNA_ORIENTATION=-
MLICTVGSDGTPASEMDGNAGDSAADEVEATAKGGITAGGGGGPETVSRSIPCSRYIDFNRAMTLWLIGLMTLLSALARDNRL